MLSPTSTSCDSKSCKNVKLHNVVRQKLAEAYDVKIASKYLPIIVLYSVSVICYFWFWLGKTSFNRINGKMEKQF